MEMSRFYIFYFIILFKPSSTLLYWDIQQFVFLTWIHLHNLFSHICKRLRPRWLTGFWMCLCCVRDNYLSVNCSTRSLLLRSSSWWFKAFHFSTFPISYETHEAHTPGVKLTTKSCWKEGDLFPSVRP